MLFSEQDSKKRKTDYGFSNYDDEAAINNDYNNFNLDLDSPGSQWNMAKVRTEDKLENLASMGGNPQLFKNSFANYMLPQDTPERRRRVYATSPQALDDVVGDYYKNEVKPRFETNRNESRQNARNEYMKYAGTVGANPVNAYHQAMRADNPMNVIDKTMDEIDHSRLVKDVAPLASYGGFDTDDYVNKFVKPALHDRMVNEYIDENKPKSSSEYIMRSALGNSVVGKAATLANNAFVGNDIHSQLEREGLARYDANRAENFAAGVGGLLIDTPVFGAFGSLSGTAVGKATSLATNRLATRFLARNAGKNISREYAQNVASRAIKENLSSKIMQSAMGQGLTLGGYDLANSVVDDVLYNSNVDFGKAAGSFAKGFATGGAVGAIGTPLKLASKGFSGGKKLLASTGVLSAESAVFTLGSEAEKIAHGVDIEPIDLIYDFGESTATLLTMRLAHWRPKGADLKLDINGRLKERLRFTGSEKEELRSNDVDAEGFMRAIEQELSTPSFGGRNGEMIKESYSQLMSNPNLSASLRSKLLLLVENKITSTPPVTFDYTVKRGNDGSFDVTMLDANGGVVSRKNFTNVDDVKRFISEEKADIRRNRISYYEKELTNGIYTQNFLRQGGEYIKEKGVDADILAEAMLKKAENRELTDAEQKIIDDIIDRSSYDNRGIITYLYNQRRAIERRNRLGEGSLLEFINKSTEECSVNENRALDEYEKVVRDEVSRLKNGVDENRYLEIFDHGMSKWLTGKDNESVKRNELFDYTIKQRMGDFATTYSYKNLKNKMGLPKPINIPELKNPDAVWNRRGLNKTREEVEEFKRHAERLASKLNLDVKIISDEREIELADQNDRKRINEYNQRINSLGWVNDGKVYLNLPNMKSISELEKTAVHESVTHAGLRKIFGNRLNEFLEEVYKRADRGVLKGIDEVRKERFSNDGYEIVEEYLARLSEKNYHTAQERGVLSRFKDFIKNMLVRQNIYTGKNRRISEHELEELMQKHSQYVLNNGKLDNRYRRKMFGDFASAKYDDNYYTDISQYGDYVKNAYEEGRFMEGTPQFMHDSKLIHNYRYLPEKAKAKLRNRWYMNDKEIESEINDDRYRWIGKKGAERLARYNFEDSGLEKAMAYEAIGTDPVAIKYKTGWERGFDGLWRKEISDNTLRVKDCIGNALLKYDHYLFGEYYTLTNKPQELWSKSDMYKWDLIISKGKYFFNNITLKDLVKDPTLFISYPELENLPVRIVANSPDLIRYDSKNKEVVVDRDFYLDDNKVIEMAGVIQNIVQDYEGFSKTISLHLLGTESLINSEYEKIMGSIDLANSFAKAYPEYDNSTIIKKYLKTKYGMTPEEFSRKFPTLDDFYIYKLTKSNIHFSGDAEMNNVKTRFGMSPLERSIMLAGETEGYPEETMVSIKKLDDLRRIFNGPLDVINNKLKLLHSDIPLDIYLDKNDGKAYFKADFSDYQKVKNWSDWLNRNDDFGWRKYKKMYDEKRRKELLERRRRRGGDEDDDMVVEPVLLN